MTNFDHVTFFQKNYNFYAFFTEKMLVCKHFCPPEQLI